MPENLFRRGLRVGCTLERHREIGVHAAINARAGEQWRNACPWHSWDLQEVNRVRDAEKVRAWRCNHVRFRQFGSRWFRRHLGHILEEIGEE